jgi:hypothetical protein
MIIVADLGNLTSKVGFYVVAMPEGPDSGVEDPLIRLGDAPLSL